MILEKIKNLNYLLIFLLILLSFIGAAGLYSAADGSYQPWTSRHLIRFYIFLLMAILISIIDIKIIYKYSYLLFILSLFLLISVEIIGVFGKGATRWIKIFGFSIQPSELIKITIILALAKFYHDLKFENIKKISSLFFPFLILFIPFIFVVIQPDLGTSLSILILGFFILFLAGIRLWKFSLGFAITIISIPIILKFIKPYQRDRVISFLDPESDPLGKGYQLIQSKIALGSGGSTGKGFLQGTQSYLEYLPEKQTDFIFTLIGEEFSFHFINWSMLFYKHKMFPYFWKNCSSWSCIKYIYLCFYEYSYGIRINASSWNTFAFNFLWWISNVISYDINRIGIKC